MFMQKGMKDGKVTIAEIGPRLKLIRQELGITQPFDPFNLDVESCQPDHIGGICAALELLSAPRLGESVFAEVFRNFSFADRAFSSTVRQGLPPSFPNPLS